LDEPRRPEQVPTGEVSLGVTCGEGCGAALPIRDALVNLPTGQWTTFGVPLKCFAEAGADTSNLDSVLQFAGQQQAAAVHLARGARCVERGAAHIALQNTDAAFASSGADKALRGALPYRRGAAS
jgi:hypothetical protein